MPAPGRPRDGGHGPLWGEVALAYARGMRARSLICCCVAGALCAGCGGAMDGKAPAAGPLQGAVSGSGQAVTIGAQPLRAGETFRVSTRLHAVDTPRAASGAGGPPDELRGERVIFERVLQVRGGQRQRWRAWFEVDRVTTREAQQAQMADSPLKGNTYVLWYEGEHLAASEGDGQPITAQELHLLRQQYGERRRGWRTLFDLLPERRFVRNVPRALTPAEVRRLDLAREGISHVVITLRAVDRAAGLARFSQQVRARLPTAGARVEVHYTGWFDAALRDGVLVRQQLRGSGAYTRDGAPYVATRSIWREVRRLPPAPREGPGPRPGRRSPPG